MGHIFKPGSRGFRTRRALAVATALAVVGGTAVASGGQAGAATGCQVAYKVSSQWSGGFVADVTIQNQGDALSGWRLTWSFPAGQKVTSGWGASIAQSGSAVTADSLSYNGSVASGGSVSFGFQGTNSGTDNPVPTSFAVNGATCGGGGGTTTTTTTTTPTTTTSTTSRTTTTTTPTTTTTGGQGGATVFATNAGGPAFTAGDGTVFSADTGFSGGSTYTNAVSIGGTTDDPLFQSERYGNFTYSRPVANGSYVVSLYFAETYHTAAGKRSFDVLMEGTERISDLDIYAQAGGNTAFVIQTVVPVDDGTLNLQFVANVENAKINAIKVTGGSTTTTTTTTSTTSTTSRTTSSTSTTSTTTTPPPPAGAKPRVINMTDLGADPDDLQSLVRMLVTVERGRPRGHDRDDQLLADQPGPGQHEQPAQPEAQRVRPSAGQPAEARRGFPSLSLPAVDLEARPDRVRDGFASEPARTAPART